jgi:O-antigen chain-terminating methyltransferase
VSGDLSSWLDAASGSDEEFLERAWRLVLRRPPEPTGRERVLAKLRDGTLSRAGLWRELLTGGEYERVAALDGGLAFAAAERAKPRDHRGPSRPRELHAPATGDERAIEIPWALARYDGERRVLDVGYAFAEPAYLAGLVSLGAEELVGVDLARADVPGLRGVVADVRKLPLDDASFDLVYCLSTLEHVGRDNEVYDVDAARDEAGDEAALRELQRVLARDGRLLVSVPTGEHDDQGWQVQRTPDDWIDVFERAGFLVYEDELYVRDADGWRGGSLEEARAARYGSGGPGAGAVLLAELHPDTVGGKLRLAVRDVRHRDDVRRSTRAS